LNISLSNRHTATMLVPGHPQTTTEQLNTTTKSLLDLYQTP
jgi:hypothetical protein